MRGIRQSPSFQKAYKKFHSSQKSIVDHAIEEIRNNPEIGELKRGDLTGLYVYKFKINKQQKLLAYTYDSNNIVLLIIGTHENFYRDIKR
jgi:mRNA-degrading endonuclease RelE of RelBE toxin-antitoxin system